MTENKLTDLLKYLTGYSKETECIEFKDSNYNPPELGKRISALSNSACLHNQDFGYLVFGVEDKTHKIIGTSFLPKNTKKGNEEIEHWLMKMLNPKIDFNIHEFQYQGVPVIIFEIPAARNELSRFQNQAYIRIGSYTKLLSEYPEKEKKIWNIILKEIFEYDIAKYNATAEEIVQLLDTPKCYDLLKLPYPSTRNAVIEKLLSEKFVVKDKPHFHITNSGAILLAKNLDDFDSLSRKTVRVIVYEDKNRIKTKKDKTISRGYAVGFEELLNYILDQLPSTEETDKAIRKNIIMFPPICIKELVANALIHQDFSITGTSVMVEIFSDRIEISNPGKPIITTDRFIDEYQSRNEKLASFMRRIGICEERGSGIDKAIFQVESMHLPPPDFLVMEKHTKAVVFAFKKLREMDRKDKIRACYQHCCLKYVSNEKMTNKSLRERFQIDARNMAIVSRIIDSTLKVNLIKLDDPKSKSKKYTRYTPFWV